jgi:hypothetical protein
VSSFGCRWTRRWVRLYTARLGSELRDGRRAEIESDLWEHLDDARAINQRDFATQLGVLTRMVTGMPADLVWRSRARYATKEHRSMKQRRLRAIAVLCAAVVLVTFFATNLLVDKSDAATHADIWWILAVPVGFFLVGTIGVVATVLLMRDRRRLRVAGVANDSPPPV